MKYRIYRRIEDKRWVVAIPNKAGHHSHILTTLDYKEALRAVNNLLRNGRKQAWRGEQLHRWHKRRYKNLEGQDD